MTIDIPMLEQNTEIQNHNTCQSSDLHICLPELVSLYASQLKKYVGVPYRKLLFSFN